MKKEDSVMKPPVTGPLVIEQIYHAPIEKVWDAIAAKDGTQHGMQQWYLKSMDDKDYPQFWKITDLVPGRKISYEWKYGGHPGNSLLTFELFDEGNKTRLILTHEKLETFLRMKIPTCRQLSAASVPPVRAGIRAPE